MRSPSALRRLLLALVTCSASVTAPACSTKTVVVDNRAAAGPKEGADAGLSEDTSKPQNPVFIELGEITTGEDVSFDIPSGALGFNITLEGDVSTYDPDAPFGIERVVDPKGNVIHDDFTPKGGERQTSVAIFDAIAAVSVPQGEGAPTDLSGKWKVRAGQLGRPSSMKLTGRVRIQSSGDGTFHGGKLDLHLHVPATLRVDGEAIEPSEAADHPGMKQRLDGFFSLTSALLGIERGDVVWHTESSTYAAIDTTEKLLDGFAVSRGAKDGTQALHILFTNEISIDDPNGGINALGIAPGITGAALTFGRGVSGIIVATTSSAQEDLLTMIHEAGHFMGLNHTTELSGGADPLRDTPECAGIDPHRLGDCPDVANVMFVAGAQVASLGDVLLSPSQQRVYRGSPVYKAWKTSAPRTMSLDLAPDPVLLAPLKRSFRLSDRPLSRIESALSAGFCGLTRIDARALVARYGEAIALAELRAASGDPDLAPFIRGGAAAALRSLGK